MLKKEKGIKNVIKNIWRKENYNFEDLSNKSNKERAELFKENKEYIIKQITYSATKSLISSKAFKEAKNNMIENAKLKEE